MRHRQLSQLLVQAEAPAGLLNSRETHVEVIHRDAEVVHLLRREDVDTVVQQEIGLRESQVVLLLNVAGEIEAVLLGGERDQRGCARADQQDGDTGGGDPPRRRGRLGRDGRGGGGEPHSWR